MRLERIAGVVFDHLVGWMMRRAALAAVIAACTLVAIYQFTVAGSLVPEAHYGLFEAHLIVGDIYAFLGLAAFIAVLAVRSRPAHVAAPATLASQRETQLLMLVEAVMLGYTLARKAHRAS
jgi:hypothetical protein